MPMHGFLHLIRTVLRALRVPLLLVGGVNRHPEAGTENEIERVIPQRNRITGATLPQILRKNRLIVPDAGVQGIVVPHFPFTDGSHHEDTEIEVHPDQGHDQDA